MTCARWTFHCILFAIGCSAAAAGQASKAAQALPTGDEIMSRVAANQDRSEAERSHYVYVQHAKTVSRKGSTVMCEEVTDYRVTPTETGSHEELLDVDGRLLTKHNYVHYKALLPDDNAKKNASNNNSKPDNGSDGLTVSVGDESIDRDLVEHIRANLINDTSKDGINSRLFPLTTKAQGEYDFRLSGRERLNGRDVYHIVFHPKAKSEFGWKGDAYIDMSSYQPVVVSTDMARKIPLAVRTLLGTNVPGLGFTIVYAPQSDGVWFPVSFGTEFKLHVLFFFRREIIIDAQNRNFERTHVDSRILSEGTPGESKEPPTSTAP